MRLIVSGAGRGGTNLMTELLKKITDLNFTIEIEDRQIMQKVLPESYATKLAVENLSFTKENISKLMDTYSDLYLIFSVRHPLDNCLSKIVRGQKSSQGGDKTTEILSADANLEDSARSIAVLYEMIDHFKSNYPDRVYYFRMEDIIRDTEAVVQQMAQSLNIKVKDYENFQSHNRNRYQKYRYGNELSRSQIDIWKDPKCYGDFFRGKYEETLDFLGEKLNKIIPIYYDED